MIQTNENLTQLRRAIARTLPRGHKKKDVNRKLTRHLVNLELAGDVKAGAGWVGARGDGVDDLWPFAHCGFVPSFKLTPQIRWHHAVSITSHAFGV